ncbi:Ribosomal protein L11/L12 [Carpediemonas membranifera]|uniref:Ribosomal protein L11/L12 n=1 Tax=Carpediemonas membranifera TaxID=201153 RepID=A0A8J6DYP0_9EUKA|nr:Ribosomal protein L11/L12 [Carpediemonas membranifera]|eukprot:KAG9392544.1 Ribosomal protein L11/L12 [Carpediemonas membranifera]
MPPKFDPTAVHIVMLRAVGGEVTPVAALAPKVGPLGVPPKKIGEDIAKNTKDWKGLKVTVKLSIQNRQATVSVVPSASSLLVKALKEAPRDKSVKGITHDGDMTIEDVYEVARVMRERTLARSFQGAVLEMLGTANSLGCTVDGKTPVEVQAAIKAGEIEVPQE